MNNILDNEIIRILLSIAKLIVAICYMMVGFLIVPRIDAAASRKRVMLIRSGLSIFTGLSVGTYLHLSWFFFTDSMPDIYYLSPLYIVFVPLHALVGMYTAYIMYTLVSVRIVDEETYTKFIDRQIRLESDRIIQQTSQEALDQLLQQSKEVKDMAELILKAYKQ